MNTFKKIVLYCIELNSGIILSSVYIRDVLNQREYFKNDIKVDLTDIKCVGEYNENNELIKTHSLDSPVVKYINTQTKAA